MNTTLARQCEVCGKDYGIGTRTEKQFAQSKYCSLVCSGKAQRSTIQDILKRVVVNPETGEVLAYADEYTIWQLLTIKGMIRDDSLYVPEAPCYSGWIHWKDFDVSKYQTTKGLN